MFWSNLLGNLSLARKFLLFAVLSGLLVALPLIAYLVMSGDSIAVARREADGLLPAKQLSRVVQLVQQHRALSTAVLGGKADREAQRATTRDETQAAIAVFSDAVAARFRDADIASAWQSARAEWTALVQGVDARGVGGADSYARHTALLARLFEVHELAADRFGLRRDVRPETYPLALATLTHLPLLTETLAQAREFGGALLAKGGTLSLAERDEMVLLAGRADIHHRNLVGTLDKAMRAAAPLRERLGRPLADNAARYLQARKLLREQVLDAAEITASNADFERVYGELIDGLSGLSAAQFAMLGELRGQRVASLRQTQFAIIAGALLLALLAAALSYAVMRSISRPLGHALGMAHRFSSGDLTPRTGSLMKDEIGRLLEALNTMRAELAGSVTDIRIAADSVSAATGEIAHGNSDLSRRTEQQATSLAQTASSMEQFTSTVKQNAENARQANLLAQEAAAVAQRGGEAARGVVSTMQGISQSSSRIADIIGVIESIAFQTNILALNAAVEAARAGEQGRGFAVVASEVRSLAQRSAQAAKEIKVLIDESAVRVGGGVREVEDAGKTMDEIVASVAHLKDLIAGIARASAEQLGGIEQVNSAIMHMDGNTQQNASLVEQAAAAAQHLLDQAHTLTASVAKFKLEEGLEAQKRQMVQDALRTGRGMGLGAGSTAATLPAATDGTARAGQHALPLRADPQDTWKSF